MTAAPDNAKPRAGYQGEPGAFSEIAARRFFPNGVTLVPCPTFDDLFAAFKEGRIEFMIAPLENTIAGMVPGVTSLLRSTPHILMREIELPIAQSLIGVPGATLENVRSAESHPVALAQCKRFFATHPGIRPVESDDTAVSVRRIMEALDPARAAVASSHAAEIHGAQVLITGIQDHTNNQTRFQLLRTKMGGSR